MLEEYAIIFQSISGFITSIVAIIALIIALRSNKRLDKQLELDRENSIPILGITTSEYIDKKAIFLQNFGKGTAVIDKIQFKKKGIVSNNMVDLFSFKEVFYWDTYWIFRKDRKFFIESGGTRTLVKLSKNNLVAQNFNSKKTLNILESWQKQIDGIEIEISYRDIFGNQVEDYTIKLRDQKMNKKIANKHNLE